MLLLREQWLSMEKTTFVSKFIAIILLFILLPASIFINRNRSYAKQMIIAIDPGHGGSASGAVGPTGLKEKAVNLSVALRLKSYLESSGARVIMTRTTDKYVSLSRRVAIANKAKANRFISVHHNASTKKSVNGTETYAYYSAGSTASDAGRKIQLSLVSALGLANRGFKRAGFYVIKYTNMPSVLTEPSFISNRTQEARLKTSSWRQKEAKAIYLGLKNHMRLSSRKDALGMFAASAPASQLCFPNVYDKSGVWHSSIYVRNVSGSQKSINIKLLSQAGAILNERNTNVNSNATYSFNPRKLLGAAFNGSMIISASGNSIVGHLSQYKPSTASVGLTGPSALTTVAAFPRVQDTYDYWRSMVTIQNPDESTPIEITTRLYNSSGGLLRTRVYELQPLASFDFNPKQIYGKSFTGMVKLESSNQFTSQLYQTDRYRRSLALMTGQAGGQNIYFPYVKDFGTYYKSHLVLSNLSASASSLTISFINFSGTIAKQQSVNLSPNATYSFTPSNLVGSNFYGMVAIQGDGGVARLMMYNLPKNAVGLLESQYLLQNHYYARLDDGNAWSTVFSIRNYSQSNASYNLELYSNNGSLQRTIAGTLGAYSGTNKSIWQLTQASYSAPLSLVGSNSQYLSSVIQIN